MTAPASDVARAERLASHITVVNVVVLGAAWAFDGSAGRTPGLAVLAGLVLVCALVGAVPIRLHFSQHRASFTLTDAVLTVGLFLVPALWLSAAIGAGELLYGLGNRRPLRRTAFNASGHAAAALAAGGTFYLLGGHRHPNPGSWLPALAAMALWGALNAGMTSLVIARAEGVRFRQTFASSLPTAATTTIVSGPIGLLVAGLLDAEPWFLLLLVPVAAGVFLNNRYAGLQRNEHLRVGRLYEATSRTAQITGDLDAVASSIAEECRLLVTASAAICLFRDGSAPWTGRTARAAGVGGTRAADITALFAGEEVGRGATVARPVPDSLQGLAADAEVLMLARSPQGAPLDLVLAVLQARSERRVEAGVGETLAAFAAHSAVMAANAGLVQELQASLAAQLEANQRKDDFVATISHELRTPLTVMLGATQTLQRLRDRLEAADEERLLQTAADQGQRLKLLIDDLLLVAAAEQNKQACELVPVSTDQLAEELVADVPDRRRARVAVTNEAPGVETLTDRFKVRQVIGNLVENSVKYADGSPVAVRIARAGGAVALSVVDHGPGIPAADHERVFDRFFQLDQSATRSQGGTGLGLYICRKLAGQLGGRLELRDTPGGGCTFTLTVPVPPRRRTDDHTQLPVPVGAPAGMLRRPVLQGPHHAPSGGA